MAKSCSAPRCTSALKPSRSAPPKTSRKKLVGKLFDASAVDKAFMCHLAALLPQVRLESGGWLYRPIGRVSFHHFPGMSSSGVVLACGGNAKFATTRLDAERCARPSVSGARCVLGSLLAPPPSLCLMGGSSLQSVMRSCVSAVASLRALRLPHQPAVAQIARSMCAKATR